WPDAALHLVYVGTIGLAQGVGTLIDAMERLRGTGIRLHLYGDGYDRAELESRAAAAALDHVEFHGSIAVADVPTVAAAADSSVVLLRSGPLYDEPLPTKLVEGLAAGRPVIVSAAGDAARIVGEAGAGFVCPPEDAEALADAIRR